MDSVEELKKHIDNFEDEEASVRTDDEREHLALLLEKEAKRVRDAHDVPIKYLSTVEKPFEEVEEGHRRSGYYSFQVKIVLNYPPGEVEVFKQPRR